MRRDGDAGYALVAAVTAVALFAYVAFEVLAADQGAVASVTGRARQARLAAAADAGLMIAVHDLATEDRTVRWSIDGRERHLDFDGVGLTVVVQDERGKAPLAGLNDVQSRALFQGAGASGERLDALVDEFRDWQAEEVVTTVEGAPAAGAEGVAPGLQPRHGHFRTVGELMALKDMDPALYARIAPAVTVFFEESGPFEPANAGPLAISAMSAFSAGESAEEIAAENTAVGQRPDEEIAPDDHLAGRTLTVSVVASDPAGDRTHRTAIVELTGDKTDPYWVRYVE